MSIIDDYLKNVPSEKRAELERIRKIAKEFLPGCEETISYGMPTLKLNGKSIIGFDAHKKHIGIYPFSGSVISKIKELNSYETSSGAIRVPFDKLMPKSLIEKIISVRLGQLKLK